MVIRCVSSVLCALFFFFPFSFTHIHKHVHNRLSRVCIYIYIYIYIYSRIRINTHSHIDMTHSHAHTHIHTRIGRHKTSYLFKTLREFVHKASRRYRAVSHTCTNVITTKRDTRFSICFCYREGSVNIEAEFRVSDDYQNDAGWCTRCETRIKLLRLELERASDRLHAKQDISSRSQFRDSDNFEIAWL